MQTGIVLASYKVICAECKDAYEETDHYQDIFSLEEFRGYLRDILWVNKRVKGWVCPNCNGNMPPEKQAE